MRASFVGQAVAVIIDSVVAVLFLAGVHERIVVVAIVVYSNPFELSLGGDGSTGAEIYPRICDSIIIQIDIAIICSAS